MKCFCGCEFAPSAETFIGAQLFSDMYLLQFNCPRILPNGKVCANTCAVLMWESEESALENAAEEEPEPMAAE